MQWIKVKVDMLNDERVNRIIVRHGMKGFGIFMALYLRIQESRDKCMHINDVELLGTRYCSRAVMMDIVTHYGFFEANGGNVRICADASVCAPVREPVREIVREIVRGGEPIKELELELEKKNIKENFEEEAELWRHEFKDHYPILAKMKKPLTLDEYHRLLKDYTNDMIRRTLERMENYPQIEKKYTSTNLTLRKWLQR